MRLADRKTIAALRTTLLFREKIRDLPETERNGRTDWEVVSQEAEKLYRSYSEGDLHGELAGAQKLLKETRNGILCRKDEREKLNMVLEAMKTVNTYMEVARLRMD